LHAYSVLLLPSSKNDLESPAAHVGGRCQTSREPGFFVWSSREDCFCRSLSGSAEKLFPWRRPAGIASIVPAIEDEFSVLPEWRAEGMTDYVAIITRFATEGVIGEMDGVYSAWATREPEGFTDDQIAALKRIVPYLGLAIKSVSLARMIRTLMETYLGRDAGQRVLSGRIVRGIAEQIDAVICFRDLRGFTRITDTVPEEMMSLLNDYSDVIISAIDEHGGGVLKLIGDGTLAIFTAEAERVLHGKLH